MNEQGNGTSKTRRDHIRSQILGARKGRTETIKFMGVEIEIRQPSIGVALEFASSEDRKDMIVAALIKHCYVPGENTLVFDDADADELMNLPFGDDIQRLMDVFTRMIAPDEAEVVKNSETPQADST